MQSVEEISCLSVGTEHGALIPAGRIAQDKCHKRFGHRQTLDDVAYRLRFSPIRPQKLQTRRCRIENIAQLVTGLHKLGIAHGDLHTRNLIIAEDDSVRLIDFDNARKSTNGIRKDLKRFRNAVSATSSYEPAITEAMKRLGHPYLND